jgi:hypothetical protein
MNKNLTVVFFLFGYVLSFNVGKIFISFGKILNLRVV